MVQPCQVCDSPDVDEVRMTIPREGIDDTGPSVEVLRFCQNPECPTKTDPNAGKP